MNIVRTTIRVITMWCALAATGTAVAVHYHGEVDSYPPWQGGKNLGELTLEVTTSSEQARQHFLTGLKLVHAYEFPEATWSFRKAQELDPQFAMAYWGEILASHMFVWYAKDPDQARDAIARMDSQADLKRINARERGLIEAGRLLVEGDGNGLMPYQQGSLLQQFRDRLALLHSAFPDDLEIKVLYGYAVLGTRRGVRDFAVNEQAAKLFQQVLAENPRHPGALHYLIHASENPEQGHYARQAAETLGEIVSASIHALHMPSHYYYTQGDWRQVVQINRAAWQASWRRTQDLGLNEDNLEYHGVGWIAYGLLQQGNYIEAYDELNRLYQLYQNRPTLTKAKYLLYAQAGYMVDAPLHSRELQAVQAMKIAVEPDTDIGAVAASLFVWGYTGWRTGDSGALLSAVQAYRALDQQKIAQAGPPVRDAVRIMGVQIEALMALSKDWYEQAEGLLRDASTMEDEMVHEHGIPLVVKPANELFADVLLLWERPELAIEHYQTSLSYQPGRLLSMQGEQQARELIDSRRR